MRNGNGSKDTFLSEPRDKREGQEQKTGSYSMESCGSLEVEWRGVLPERYGPWSTVYKRFAQWQESGLFEKIFKDLAIDADLQDMSLDSTSIKAHQSSAGAKKGM